MSDLGDLNSGVAKVIIHLAFDKGMLPELADLHKEAVDKFESQYIGAAIELLENEMALGDALPRLGDDLVLPANLDVDLMMRYIKAFHLSYLNK